jgi:nucleotide sugar dehydrogenase
MVGGALADVYEELIKERHEQESLHAEFVGTEIYRYDPFKGLGTEEEAYKADIAFVCVPSPTKGGEQDLTAIHKVVEAAIARKFAGTLVIKSTVLPGTTQTIRLEMHGETAAKVCHCPEFLREKTAHADLKDMNAVPIAGPAEHRALPVRFLKALGYQPIEADDSAVSETAKYMHNVFCAMKVTFCNEIWEACRDMGLSYDDVLAAAQGGERIGRAHAMVPGPDGGFGYSGACFPKDVWAFTRFLNEEGMSFPLIESIRESNETRRPHDENCKPVA